MKYFAVFVFVVAVSCTHQKREVVVNWRDNKAISISVPDSVVVYGDQSQYSVLGEITKNNGGFVFTPTVPFQRGLSYLAISKVDTLPFTILRDSTAEAPVVIATYPSCETVPSNLLKIYIQFSEPMQEYRSSEFVRLIDMEDGDTVRNAFLDLKPELWNEDGTVLTLWIDPGRIKQDLIPNKELGVVLKEHHNYRLEIDSGWMSKKGERSIINYKRTFKTSTRDVTRPDISQWRITATADKVIVDTKGSLDWMLLNSTVSIRSTNQLLTAKTFSEVCETQLSIIPVKPLSKGTYTLDIQAILEDAAGNNLNRLFETDVTASSKNSVNKEVYSLMFEVH